MAQGTFTLFNEAVQYLGSEVFNLPTGGDTFKCSLITNAVVPAVTDANPVLGDYT